MDTFIGVRIDAKARDIFHVARLGSWPKREIIYMPPRPHKDPTIILMNYVHSDGIGDFQHLLDIAKELHPLALQSGIVIVPLIFCLANIRETVEKKINKLNINLKPFIFTVEKKHPELEQLNEQFSKFMDSQIELQNNLNNALTIFQISTATTTFQKNILLKHCFPNIPIVNISEHSGLRTFADFSFGGFGGDSDERDKPRKIKNINDRWMGLQRRAQRYGIKLRPPLAMSREEALLSFEDQNYLHILLGTDATSLVGKKEVADFIQKTQIIPAYLQRGTSIINFIWYCIKHEQYSDNDIVIHINNNNVFNLRPSKIVDAEDLSAGWSFSASKSRVSGGNEEILMPAFELMMLEKDVQKYNIGSIEINVNGAEPRTISFGHWSATKKIRILVGFYLEDEDYNKLYHASGPIIAVSGDNTIEQALSNNKLPFLQDDKYEFEEEMHALFHLALEYWPDMSSELKLSFTHYFLNKNMRLDNEEGIEQIVRTDWEKMHEVWPYIMGKLRQNNNIYNHLKTIFYEALLHASAEKGDVTLLNTIYSNAPEIDVTLPNKMGKTVLQIARMNNHIAYVQELSILFPRQLIGGEIPHVPNEESDAMGQTNSFFQPALSPSLLAVEEAKQSQIGI
ncbi:hypothetical protein [Legionella maioricensis]|uniref:Uncharacterized protein n=1 Tax=Legionella maioricensis TaxID=2896528 RepID=A0A9X2IDD2_9GAMM|nr:hypothetical protein [Legionella maioricensis]MCL9685417.1 hypothetical protein [Legionella maioricensis]MCL9688719.1 hypothetical protein [Legionella maioricensis]